MAIASAVKTDMKSSELEVKLKELREQHGDLDVAICTQCGSYDYDVETVKLEVGESATYFLIM